MTQFARMFLHHLQHFAQEAERKAAASRTGEKTAAPSIMASTSPRPGSRIESERHSKGRAEVYRQGRTALPRGVDEVPATSTRGPHGFGATCRVLPAIPRRSDYRRSPTRHGLVPREARTRRGPPASAVSPSPAAVWSTPRRNPTATSPCFRPSTGCEKNYAPTPNSVPASRRRPTWTPCNA